MPKAEAAVRLGLKDLVASLEGVRRRLSELAEGLPPDPPGEADAGDEDPLRLLRAAIECAVDHLRPAIQALAAEAAPGPKGKERPMTEAKTPGTPEERAGRLDPEQLPELLRELPGWRPSADGRQIVRQITFPSVVSCLLFVYIVLELATETPREPYLHIRGRTLQVTLGGQSGEGLTWADLDFAQRIDLGEGGV